MPQAGSGPNRWDLIEGLNVIGVDGESPAAGQHLLRLTALASEGRHAIAVRFGGLTADTVYRVTLWLKANPTNRIMIEARDAVVATTGKRSNYGVAQFDMIGRTVIKTSGDFVGQGVEQAPDCWLKVWSNISTKDGQIFVLVGMLESPRNLHVFKGAGQDLILGGFEIALRQ